MHQTYILNENNAEQTKINDIKKIRESVFEVFEISFCLFLKRFSGRLKWGKMSPSPKPGPPCLSPVFTFVQSLKWESQSKALFLWVPLKADTEMTTWEQVVHLGADPKKQKWASREADISVCYQSHYCEQSDWLLQRSLQELFAEKEEARDFLQLLSGTLDWEWGPQG